MLKHRFSALMILHDAETPLCSTVHFSDAETPLCSTVHFSDAETPPKNTGDCLLDAETPLLGTFHFFQSQKHPIPPSFSLPKQLRLALVSLFPLPLLQHHSQQLFPLLKHQQPFIPLLLLKHRLSATFSSVSPDAETPLFSILFIPFPSSLPFPIIDETILSSNCFASFLLKHHLPKQPFIIHPRC
jgi:hypothetical protein